MRYIIISIISGILFGVMDGLINANSLARGLFKVYQPIARTTINIPAGIVIDMIYGFVMAGIFLILYPGLPGDTGLAKGISFALLVVVLSCSDVSYYRMDDVHDSYWNNILYLDDWIS